MFSMLYLHAKEKEEEERKTRRDRILFPSFFLFLAWLADKLARLFFSRAKDFWLDKRGEGRIGRRDIYSFFLWKGERRGKLVLREERKNEKNRMEVSVAAAAFCMNINVTNKVGVSRRDRQLGGKNLQLRIKPSFKTYTYMRKEKESRADAMSRVIKGANYACKNVFSFLHMSESRFIFIVSSRHWKKAIAQ